MIFSEIDPFLGDWLDLQVNWMQGNQIPRIQTTTMKIERWCGWEELDLEEDRSEAWKSFSMICWNLFSFSVASSSVISLFLIRDRSIDQSIQMNLQARLYLLRRLRFLNPIEWYQLRRNAIRWSGPFIKCGATKCADERIGIYLRIWASHVLIIFNFLKLGPGAKGGEFGSTSRLLPRNFLSEVQLLKSKAFILNTLTIYINPTSFNCYIDCLMKIVIVIKFISFIFIISRFPLNIRSKGGKNLN